MDSSREIRCNRIKDRREYYQRHVNDPKFLGWCKGRFYYQDGKYITIPIEQKNALDLWFDKCVRDINTPFVLKGSIGYSDVRDLERDYFTIDYDKDVEIVPNIDLKKEMAAYNTEHNTERNKEHGKARIEKRARELITADSFTRDDLAEWGYSPNAVGRLLRAGLIVKTNRRTSDRKCIYEKNFV